MKKLRKPKIVQRKPLDRTAKRMPIVKGPVRIATKQKPTRAVVWLKGGEVKQVEYTFVGLRKEVIFKLKDMKLAEIRKIVKALGIDWEPVAGDADADYIKFIPRTGDVQ